MNDEGTTNSTEVDVVTSEVTTQEDTSVSAQGTDQEVLDSNDVRSMSPFLREYYKEKSPDTEEISEEGDGEEGDGVEGTTTTDGTTDANTTDSEDKVEPEITKLKIADDLEATPEEIKEWKNGYMMQADYTRKTQELAREREDFANRVKDMENNSTVRDALDLWDNLARDPIGIINALRDHYEEQGITEARDPEVVKMEIERDKVARENSQLKTSEAKRIFNEHMDGLVARYKDEGFDREKVLEYCLKYNIPNPETAWQAMQEPLKVQQASNSRTKELEDRIADLEKKLEDSAKKTEEESKKAVGSYVKGKVDRTASFVTPVGTGGSGSAVTATVPKTFREARMSAIGRLGAK